MKKIIFLVVLAFGFGLLSAYLSVQIFNSIDVDNEHPKNHWYDFFIVTVYPAELLNHVVKLDLSNEYEETIDRDNVIPIMLLNGAAWVLIAVTFLLFIWSLKSSRNLLPNRKPNAA
jgi:hypothetical protein